MESKEQFCLKLTRIISCNFTDWILAIDQQPLPVISGSRTSMFASMACAASRRLSLRKGRQFWEIKEYKQVQVLNQ